MTDLATPRTFNTVIQDLRTSYPPEKMDEISTSFCFICLLHLANERGLKLEVESSGDNELSDPAVEEGGVGHLWGVKVRIQICYV